MAGDGSLTTTTWAGGRSSDVGAEGSRVIVVGIEPRDDGEAVSRASSAAFAHAARIARAHRDRVVPVWIRPPVAIGDTFADTVDTLARERKDEEVALGRTMKRAADGSGIAAIPLIVRDGDPFEELTDVADKLGAEAVVVGVSEHRLGSLATRLIRDARWPVTVVPSQPLHA